MHIEGQILNNELTFRLGACFEKLLAAICGVTLPRLRSCWRPGTLGAWGLSERGSDTAGNVCEALPKGSFNDIRTGSVIGQWTYDTAGYVRQAMPKGSFNDIRT